MEQQLLQLGAGGLFALLVLREVFGFLKERVRYTHNAALEQMAKEVHEMHEWHAVTDEDGVKVWYIRRSLENTLDNFAGASVKLMVSPNKTVWFDLDGYTLTQSSKPKNMQLSDCWIKGQVFGGGAETSINLIVRKFVN